jgi:hypothetical protein
MTIGRRFELLMCNAAHNIAEPRRKELLELAICWMESEQCGVRSAEELFYMFGAMTGIFMEGYSEEIQAQIGAEIIERDLAEK